MTHPDKPASTSTILAQIDQTQRQTDSSLTESIRLAEQCVASGNTTLIQLKQQTEQINRIDDTLCEVDGDVHQSHKLLRSIKGFTGWLFSGSSSSSSNRSSIPSSKHASSHRELTPAASRLAENVAGNKRPTSPVPLAVSVLTSTTTTTRSSDRITPPPSRGGGGRSPIMRPVSPHQDSVGSAPIKAAQDQKIDQLASLVQQMKHVSIGINSTVKDHNELLTNVTDHMDLTGGSLANVTQRTKNMT